MTLIEQLSDAELADRVSAVRERTLDEAGFGEDRCGEVGLLETRAVLVEVERRLRVKTESRTLVIAAHQDDEVLSCGGLILTRRQAGQHVRLLTLFSRKYGYGEGNQYVEEQHRAYERALKILGVTSCHLWLLEEGEPQQLGWYKLLKIIEEELALVQPVEVVIHSGKDLNQDHR